MKQTSHTPDLTKRAFARTNPQTIAQRVALLRELLPGVTSIAELCCMAVRSAISVSSTPNRGISEAISTVFRD